MLQARPLIFREKYYSGVEQAVNDIIDEVIYRPMREALSRAGYRDLFNATGALRDAVQAGRVWYDGGLFKGKFNAAISKELRDLGAAFNSRLQSWVLPRERVPAEISFAQAHADARYDKLREGLIRSIDDMQPDDIDAHKTVDMFGHAVDAMEADLEKTGVAAIAIPTKLTEKQREIISEEWGQNLNLYIKNWMAEDILELREVVQPHGLQGGRAEALVGMLQKNFGVSKTKAKFLARQETSLLMSKFRETRYGDMGITEYKWSGSLDQRERPDHLKLQGKIYRFDQPPITNAKTGARNNPGEDFGCRCQAIPVIR